jgi:hypothetical protein
MERVVLILGAADPEMETIERLAREAGCAVGYATHRGARVRPETAYQADGVEGMDLAAACDAAGLILVVECGPAAACDDWGWIRTGLVPGREDEVDCAAVVLRVDHHRPGDPGYGRPPAEYWQASSLGQVCAALDIEPADELRLVAAADHCLAAAYRGECPGVDPDELMAWRAASRARFQRRPVEAVLADVERAREALRAAPVIELAPGVTARDLRGQAVPELPEAAAREGICFVGEQRLPDGRVKIVHQCGTPFQVKAFMEQWAPAQGLVDIYGAPARGFAGGYLAKKEV